jgi:hypothetical protein
MLVPVVEFIRGVLKSKNGSDTGYGFTSVTEGLLSNVKRSSMA